MDYASEATRFPIFGRRSGGPWPRRLSWRAHLGPWVLCLLGCGGGAPAPESTRAVLPPDAPRRVILVTIDTLRADRLGSGGYARQTSPFLDRLAAEGTQFTRAYSSCSHTAPSHATLFTGLEPAQHGLLRNGETLHDELLTLAEIFRRAGYRTGAFSTVGFVDGLAQGFGTFSTWRQFRPATEVLGRARQWIATQGSGARLFVWIHLFDVHQWEPLDQVDPEGRAQIDREELQGETLASYLEEHHGMGFEVFERSVVVEAANRYDGQVWSTDRALASFWEALGPSFHDDALWVITSDHGEGLGNHGSLGHGEQIYDTQLRVPLFFVGRGVTPGLRIEQPVGLVDLAPTLAERIGASFEDQRFPIAGRSLGPLLAGGERPPAPLWAQRRPVDAVRIEEGWDDNEVFSRVDEGLKIIVRTDGRYELYDLENDPYELDDLATRDDPEIGRRRDQLLRQAVQQYQVMTRQGAEVAGDGIDPSHIEELEALGYL